MATKRTSFLKRQKEQKRIEKAMQKREDRMQRRFEKSDETPDPLNSDFDEETTGQALQTQILQTEYSVKGNPFK
jgi:hypothetical protein